MHSHILLFTKATVNPPEDSNENLHSSQLFIHFVTNPQCPVGEEVLAATPYMQWNSSLVQENFTEEPRTYFSVVTAFQIVTEKSTCWPHVSPELGGWSFTSVFGQMNVRPAVGWQVLALNGLLLHGIIIIELRWLNLNGSEEQSI